MHNVLDPMEWVPDELAQLRSSGYSTDAYAAAVAEAIRREDRAALLSLAEQMRAAVRTPGWRFDEPSDVASLLAALPSDADACVSPWRGTPEQLRSRLEGAWLGRCIGCCLGKPVEGLTRREVELYSRAAGAYPLTDYLPLLDPLPDGVSHLHESAPFSAAGRFDATPRDDDLDWTILGLSVLEVCADPDTGTIAQAWLDSLPFTQTFTAERAAYRNLIHGLQAPETATRDNPYREWIGALIRADIFGYVNPGHPARAVELALADARLSHVGNGIYGEMWASALVSCALTADSMRGALAESLRYVPAQSRLHEALTRTIALHDSGASWPQAMDTLDAELAHYDWVHTINNAAHIAAGLLWGDGDFTQTVSLTIQAGCDTDSSGATAGSVFGAMHGESAIPPSLSKPLNNSVRSAIRGFDRITITELAERTHRLAVRGLGSRRG